MLYAFSENYILPISHDEVVYGKRSLLDKMSGSYEEKFAGLRAYLGFMMAHPGKKLLFMSSEIGQFKEWDFRGSVEFQLLDFAFHKKFQDYVAALNAFYLDNEALWGNDLSWDGFEWSVVDDAGMNIAAFRRIGETGKELLCLFNFAPVMRESYPVGVLPGSYRQVFCSDDPVYGGWGFGNKAVLIAQEEPSNGYHSSIQVTVPPLSATFFERLKAEE